MDNWEKAALIALLAGFSSLVISSWNYEETHVDVAELKMVVRDLEKQVARLEGAARAQQEAMERLEDAEPGSSQQEDPATPARR